MAQVNLTLSEQEVLQVLTGDRESAIKYLLERILNELMKAESEEQLGASRHERTAERNDYRNGTRERDLNTRIGKITLRVPRHRNEPFHTMIFDNYQRSEACLIAAMMQMVVDGISTRKVEKVVEKLCGTGFSKSTISELCKRLDAEIRDFNERLLTSFTFPFVMVDATYFKVRENHRIKSKAFFVALGFKEDGMREVLGFDVFDAEENYSWITFFNHLKKRGLKNVKMFISDAHPSIRKAIADVYPEAAWQRCQVHLERNIVDAAPVKYKEGLKTELRNMFNATTLEEAERIKNQIVEDYRSVAKISIERLEAGFWDSMTVMCIRQANVRVVLRTSNLLERLNRELKRRSDAIQIFPNADSVFRLMGAVAMEYHNGETAKHRLYSEERYNVIENEIEKPMKEIATRQITELKVA